MTYKKIIILSLTATIMAVCTGCSFDEKPDKVVSTFCDALKAFDMTTAASCIAGNEFDLDNNLAENADNSEGITDAYGDQFISYLKEEASNLTYTIGNITIDGDTATVPVSFTYTDASPLVSEAISEYLPQAFSMAFGDTSDDDFEELFASILMNKLSAGESAQATADIAFFCEKTDGQWLISPISDEKKNDLLNILTCNFARSMESFTASTNIETDSSNTDSVWLDVPMGETVELATIKLCITSCEETSELTAAYYDSSIAQDGTKYVVFSADVENITKEPITFNNDIPLIDGQGRTYEPFSDAFWYFDEAFSYATLAPNIKQSGVFVYNIPSDSENYYLAVGKAGTNEMYRLYGK